MNTNKPGKNNRTHRTHRRSIIVQQQHMKPLSELAAVRNCSVATLMSEFVVAGIEASLNSEELYLGAITKLNRKINALDTKVAVTVECIFQFVKLYLVHTPPIPSDLIKDRSALAGERFNKYFKGLESNLTTDVKLLARLMEAFFDDTSDAAPPSNGEELS